MSRADDYCTIKNPSKVRRVGYKGNTMLSVNNQLNLLVWIHDRNSKDMVVSHAVVSLYCKNSITSK